MLSFKLLFINVLPVHPLGEGDVAHVIAGLFHHFFGAFLPVHSYCFSPTACGTALLFLCVCVLSGMVAWGLMSRATFWGTLGRLWLNTNAPLPPRSLVSHLWLFKPFLCLMDGLVSMTHKVIQTPILTYLAVSQCGFIDSSPGKTRFFLRGREKPCAQLFAFA